MFGSTVLEVAIGMVFLFLSVSLICSGIGSKIAEWLSWRSQHLEASIRALLLNGDPTLVNQLYHNELIKSLAPAGMKPISIPARTFVLAVFDVFEPNGSNLTTIQQIHNSIATLSDSPLKEKLLALVTGAETSIEGARKNVESWFNAAEERMTLVYHQKMWTLTLLIGLAVSILLNADALAVGTTLWKDPSLRSTVASAATEYAKQSAENPTDAQKQANAVKALDALNKLNLPVGWQLTIQPDLSLTPNDWAQSAQPVDGKMWLEKIFGWIITGLAGAQGAPFWFDLLKKLTRRN
jgi:hypothetical protein